MKGATDTVNNGIADVALALRTMHARGFSTSGSRFRDTYALSDRNFIRGNARNCREAYDSAKKVLGVYGSLFWREMRTGEEISIKASEMKTSTIDAAQCHHDERGRRRLSI